MRTHLARIPTRLIHGLLSVSLLAFVLAPPALADDDHDKAGPAASGHYADEHSDEERPTAVPARPAGQAKRATPTPTPRPAPSSAKPAPDPQPVAQDPPPPAASGAPARAPGQASAPVASQPAPAAQAAPVEPAPAPAGARVVTVLPAPAPAPATNVSKPSPKQRFSPPPVQALAAPARPAPATAAAGPAPAAARPDPAALAPAAAPAAPAAEIVAGLKVVAAVPSLGADFVLLSQQLGGLLGQPVESEQSLADGCGMSQRTTAGLAYVSCDTGLVGFAAWPDGMHHWALADDGVVEWFGPQSDPPATAGPLGLDMCGDPSATYCRLEPGASVAGYMQAAEATNAYQFVVTGPSMHIVASLTDLPADYDLYLQDGTGSIVGASVNEGTTPEQIDQVLSAGTYMLYVHVDAARPFDAENAYRLTLSMEPSSVVQEPAADDVGATAVDAAGL